MSGRELPPSSPFAGDDGTADERVTAALDAYSAGEQGLGPVVAALAGTRVLVPVLAQAEATDVVVRGGHEHTVDREASAGIVALQAPDGRTALPVFTSSASMAAWRSDARPVPSDVARAALSAVSEGWEVLVVDPGGPVTALLPRPAVWALAQQADWSPAVLGTGDDRVVDPAVAARVGELAAGVPELVWARAEPGRGAEVAVVLGLVDGLDRARLDAALARVNELLATDETVASRVDSLELRLRPAVSGGGAGPMRTTAP